jgi:hypothetical protein
MRDQVELPDLPFPFSCVSNGEWCPPGASAKQRAAVELCHEEASKRARRLGMTRRDFVRSAAGTLTAFLVLNTVYGVPSTGGAAPMRFGRERCDDPEAARELLAKWPSVMDVQLHQVDLSGFTPQVRALIAPFACRLRFLEAALSCDARIDRLSQLNFIKEVFVDSEPRSA